MRVVCGARGWRGRGVGVAWDVCVCVLVRWVRAVRVVVVRRAREARGREDLAARAIRDVVCMRAVGVRVVWCRVWWCGARVASLCGVKKGRMTD